jgi:nuclear pore complex protein Nup107
LSQAISSSEISLSKTRALVGESLDLHSLETEGYEEDITERIEDPAGSMRLLKRHLVAEAKSFRDLEMLVGALDCLEFASDSIHALQRYFGNPYVNLITDILDSASHDKLIKESRINLHKALQPTRATVRALLQDWLLTSQKG